MKIMIGTPTYDGKLDVHYNESLINTCIQGLKLGLEIIPFYIAYDALIQRARNDIFKIAYHYNVDCLFFIDADIGWDPDNFFKLVLNQNHIVGGTYRKKTDNEELYVLKIKDNEQEISIEQNLIEVQGLGMGFTKIDNYAIKKIWENSEKYVEDNIEKANVFFVEIKDNTIISEDIVFCNNWINLDEKIYLDSSITCNHTGIKTFYGNFENWIAQNFNDK